MSGTYWVTALGTVLFLTFGFAADTSPRDGREPDTSKGSGWDGGDSSGIPDGYNSHSADTAGDSMKVDSSETDTGEFNNRGPDGMRDDNDPRAPGAGDTTDHDAQNQSGYENQGYGGEASDNGCCCTCGDQGYGGRSGGYGNQGFAGTGPRGAVIPHYLVADASLFITNAAITARILHQEGTLSMQDATIIGSQTAYLHDILARAIQDLQVLQTDAERSNPKATASIRETITQLTAAEGQVNNLTSIANQGALSLACTTTVNAALGNLLNAQKSLVKIGDAYSATEFTSLSSQCPSVAVRKSRSAKAVSGKKVKK